MLDIRMDGPSLEALQRDLGDVRNRLDGVRDAFARVDASTAGVEEISKALHSFAGSWKHGVSQLGDHAGDASSMLGDVLAAFARVDAELRLSPVAGP